MNDEKVKGKIQDAKTRIKNFNEVELGYTKEEALKEANRCLQCVNPRCVKGCPVGIMIPEFIKCIKEDNLEGAYEVIGRASSLPAICGRVCPQEKQCESMCIKGLKGDAISIGSLERFVADNVGEIKFKKPKSNGKKVAIVGSGPSGLACAYDLAKEGFSVTIFEILHKAGGVLTYGIPEFRLPKAIVEKQISNLKELGVEILTDVLVGNTITLDTLQKDYDAVFLGTGAGLPKFMGIPGEDANGVFSANEILTRINLMSSFKDDSKTPIKKGKKVYVVGGGNVAMDAVRSLKRLGLDAHIMYRRSEEELPARKMEVEHAKEEGIVFDLLTNPKEILVDENNNVIGMNVVNMILTEPKEDGRRGVEEDPKTLHKVDCDMIVMALGTSPNNSATKDSSIATDDKGLIIVENTKTNLDKVYAGGDAVTGAATVILAMEAGKKAASEIMEGLK
jgi:glutamate synthase (NADPH/NADH) small chain